MSTFIYPFWSRQERRLRAFWRVLLQLVVLFVLLFMLGSLTVMLLADVGGTMGGTLEAIITTIVILLTTAVAALLIDRRRIIDYGLHFDRQWWTDFVFGLALGVVMMGFIFVVSLALGWINITETFFVRSDGAFAGAIVLLAVRYICVGITEEVLMRGLLMRNLAEGFSFINPRLGLLLAWILSSVVFGFAHALNPNATLISSINLSAAGLLLGLPVLLTGRLGLAIGLHMTWNFAEGNIFGFPVSGSATPVSFFGIEQLGPDVWTGAAFGPEAGLIGLVGMVLGAVLILLWTRWQDQRLALHDDYAVYEPHRGKRKIVAEVS